MSPRADMVIERPEPLILKWQPKVIHLLGANFNLIFRVVEPTGFNSFFICIKYEKVVQNKTNIWFYDE